MIRIAQEEDIQKWRESQILINKEKDALVEQWFHEKRHELSAKLEEIFRNTVGNNEDNQYSIFLPTGLKADSDIGQSMLEYYQRSPHYFSTIAKSRLQVWNLVKNQDAIGCIVTADNGSTVGDNLGEIFIQLTKQK